jgi:hypothetical protein
MDTERGAIAAFALAVLGVLSILTGAWIRMAVGERDTVRLEGDALLARSLAQAGIERTLAWFADPGSFAEGYTAGTPGACQAALIPGDLFRKRCVGADGLPGFRAPGGASQFGGTLDSPGLFIPWDDALSLVRTPAVASTDEPDVIPPVRIEVRLLAPVSPDAVVTVVSRAVAGRAAAMVRAELTEGPWRGATEAVFTHRPAAGTIPVRVHWGGVAIHDAWDATGLLDRIPRRMNAAAVTGEEYAAEPGEDRWAAIAASGAITGPAIGESAFAAPFEHLRQYAAVPRIGLWGYEALKAYAKRYGRYFTTRGTGLLYPDAAAAGVSPTVVFASHSGDRRLLFIDTIDRTSPRDDNLDTLRTELDFVRADAYVGAHLTVAPAAGRPVVLDSPSAPDDPEGPPVARTLTIAGVHYHGVLAVAGVIEAEARTRLVGTLAAHRGVRDAGAWEVWYDAALRAARRSGFPPVMVKPGTRRFIVEGG